MANVKQDQMGLGEDPLLSIWVERHWGGWEAMKLPQTWMSPGAEEGLKLEGELKRNWPSFDEELKLTPLDGVEGDPNPVALRLTVT